MTKTTAEKLCIKPSSSLFPVGEDTGLWQLLDPFPAGSAVVESASMAEVAIHFVTSRADLDAKAETHLADLCGARATWLAYPKGGRADINRGSIWRRAEELGWTVNADISLSETWSDVRIKPQS